jgi:hypothetical protein
VLPAEQPHCHIQYVTTTTIVKGRKRTTNSRQHYVYDSKINIVNIIFGLFTVSKILTILLTD